MHRPRRELELFRKPQRLDNYLEARCRTHTIAWYDITTNEAVARWATLNKHRWFYVVNHDAIRIPNLNRSRHHPRARNYAEARKIAILRGIKVQRVNVA